MRPVDQDTDRARWNMLQHRRLEAEKAAVADEIERHEEHRASRAARRAVLLERLRRVGRYFDPLGDRR
jgi:hypothetical protein